MRFLDCNYNGAFEMFIDRFHVTGFLMADAIMVQKTEKMCLRRTTDFLFYNYILFKIFARHRHIAIARQGIRNG